MCNQVNGFLSYVISLPNTPNVISEIQRIICLYLPTYLQRIILNTPTVTTEPRKHNTKLIIIIIRIRFRIIRRQYG